MEARRPETGYPLLWTDLETTGLDVEQDDILEWAAVITTPFPEVKPLWRREHVFRLTEYGRERLKLSPVVVEMHRASGLIEACCGSGPFLSSPFEFAVAIQGALDQLGIEQAQPAGTGVAAFDLHIFRLRFPSLYGRLYYGALDVGQLRRWARVAGVRFDDGPPAHRAMADVEHAQRQAFQLLGAFGAPSPVGVP